MDDFNSIKWKIIPDGYTCSHKGCYAHRTHPCEACGRIQCKGETKLLKKTNMKTNKKRIFIVCSVRGVSDEYKKKLEDYVAELESDGHKVHLPHRDTNQEATGYEITMQNFVAIFNATEVHVFYSSASQGTHFDIGVCFALNKKIVLAENEEFGEGKSYARMLIEWIEKGQRGTFAVEKDTHKPGNLY